MKKIYSDEEISSFKDFLKNLVKKRNYKNELNSKKNLILRNFINDFTKEKLNNPFFTIQTKIFWILNDVHEFPKCQNENCNHILNDVNVLNVKTGYQKYCSVDCSNSSKNKKELTKRNIIKKYGSFDSFLKNKSEKLSKTYKLKTDLEKEKIKEKRRKTNINNFGVDCNLNLKSNKDKSKLTLFEKYGVEFPTQSDEIKRKIENTKLKRYNDRFFTNREKSKETCLKKYGFEYAISSKSVRDKAIDTNLKRYGVENGGASEIAHEKIAKKYFYNNLIFSSSSELAYYIWLQDNNIKFEYQPEYIEYFDEFGNKHRYFPDFKVNDKYVELKGDHFLNKDGKLKFPYKKNLSKEQIERIQKIFNAKQKCMEDNHVILIKFSECNKYFDFVKNKYGTKYLENFRKK